MSDSLNRRQAIVLGFVTILALAGAAAGLLRVGGRQGVWAETFEVVVEFPDGHDILAGTAVRLRGVEAGQVTAVEYPLTDEPNSAVLVRLRLDERYRDRLYADATAQLHSTGLLGAKVIAVSPGTRAAGPLETGRLRPTVAPDFTQAAAKLARVADEAETLLHDIRTGNGSASRLVRDDDLYHDLKSLIHDSRVRVQKLDGFLADGQDTLKSIRAGTDAMQKMPIIRSYVPDDVTSILFRPDQHRECHTYTAIDLFDPASAVLTPTGQEHMRTEANWLKTITSSNADVVIAATVDPNDPFPATQKLTQLRAEAIVKFLQAEGAHRLGWVTRRKLTAVGLGTGPPAVREPTTPPATVQVLLFTPAE